MSRQGADFTTMPQFVQFIALVRRVLAPCPEALAAVAQALDHPGPAVPPPARET